MATTKFIRATGHIMVGNSGGPSDVLAPGERVRFNKDLDSHKSIVGEIADGRVEAEIVDIDLEAEKASEKEREELLKQAEEIAARAAQEQAAAAAGASTYDPSGENVADVITYLKTASPEEVARVQELEAASERSSTQIADFKPKTNGG